MITAAALLLFTFFCLILSLDRAWSNVTLPERNDLVFEGRHRGYGAYQLRREYDHRLLVAFLFTVGLLLLLAALPKVVSWLTPPVTVLPPAIPGIVVTMVLPPVIPDNPPSQKLTTTAASKTPPEVISLVVPVYPVLAPLPDTVHTRDVEALTPPLENDGGGTMGSDSAQIDALTARSDTSNILFEGPQVDELPVFPGGNAALGPWVRDHLVFPQGLSGKDVVYVQFTVGRDGAVMDTHALTGKQELCKDAAERTVAGMPRWKPARMSGHDVPCRLTLPIRFEVR